jgi:hypothetical protein
VSSFGSTVVTTVACVGLAALCTDCARARKSSGTRAASAASAAAPAKIQVEAPAPPRVALDGVELANHQAGPEFIAVDERFVYWTNYQDDHAIKVAKDGSGAAMEMHRNDRGRNKEIAVGADAAYWGGTALYQQVKSTGKVQRFNGGSKLVYNLRLVKDRLYFADDHGPVQLKSMKRDGTDITAIGPAETQSFLFATDGKDAFVGRFHTEAEDTGRIDVLPLAGGKPRPFVETRWLWSIAVDDRYVYWLEGKSAGAIKRKAKRGGGEVVNLTQGFEMTAPQSLIADASSLYWSALGVGAGQGEIGKVSKTGGDARLLARHQIVPQSLAVDDAFVYWVNFGPTNNGSVRKVPK